MKAALLVVQLCSLSTLLEGANILVVLPFSWYSHTFTFMPVFRELARRGHNVTMVSPYPQKDAGPNWTDLTVNSTAASMVGGRFLKQVVNHGAYKFYPLYFKLCSEVMEAGLQEENLQKLIKAEGLKFDLVITEVFFAHEPLVAFGHKFGAPVVAIYPLSLTPWVSYMTGNEISLTLATNFRTDYTNRLTFFQRLDNTLVNVVEFLIGYFIYIPRQESLMDKHMVYPGSEDRPSLRRMLNEVSLHLVDYHFSIGYVNPLQPNTIPVGGMSLKHLGQLPKDLQDLMDSSENGVIYLSFGSFVKGSTLPPGFLQSLLEAFGRLGQTVLMKSNSEDVPDTPKNVQIRNWFPQVNILAHPKLRLFITHAGIHGITEAAYFGVPVICIPFFTDQKYNAKMAEQFGFGLTLLKEDVTADSLHNAITNILENPRFKETALERSAIVRDRPHSALDSAVYWIEYVLRHRGAKHLRPARLDLQLFQLLCLDIVLFLVLLIAVPFLLLAVCKRVFRSLRFQGGTKSKQN